MREFPSDGIRRWLPAIGSILLVAIVAILITFNQSLADWWGRLPIGRLMAPLGGFDVHVALWFGVGVVLLRLTPTRRAGDSRVLGYAFLASLSFEISQPVFTPRNFEVADLSANFVGLALAAWWHLRGPRVGVRQ